MKANIGDKYKGIYRGITNTIWEVVGLSGDDYLCKCIVGNTTYKANIVSRWSLTPDVFECISNKSNNFKQIYDILNETT